MIRRTPRAARALRALDLRALVRSALVPSLALLAFASACRTSHSGAHLARFHAVSDLDTYHLARVAVLPFSGAVDPEQAALLATTFAGAFSQSADFEVRVLTARDLDGIPATPTFERGWTRPETVIELGRRFGLDAVVVGDVRRAQWFPPQRLDVRVELVAVETGASIWSGTIDVDAGDQRARRALETWYAHDRAHAGERTGSWEIGLISPRLFAEFTAQMLASGL